MEYFALFVTVGIVHLFALMSPGPDFFMVMKNTLSYSRKAGIYTSLGISIGLIVHIAYSLIGIGFIISQSILLFNILKWIGAAYLIYIGWKSLLSKDSVFQAATMKKEMSPLKAFRIGFLTNVFNPKATLYFLSLFTVVISPTTPLSIQLLLGIGMILLALVWFVLLTLLLSQPLLLKVFRRIQKYFERAMGALLIGLGIKIAVSE